MSHPNTEATNEAAKAAMFEDEKIPAGISTISVGVDLTCPICNGSGKAEMPKTMGARIALLREQRGLSRATAATNADISGSLWGKIESDDSKNPSLSTILAIAKALDVKVGYLLGE